MWDPLYPTTCIQKGTSAIFGILPLKGLARSKWKLSLCWDEGLDSGGLWVWLRVEGRGLGIEDEERA